MRIGVVLAMALAAAFPAAAMQADEDVPFAGYGTKPPPGSYRRTCEVLSVSSEAGMLEARCGDGGGHGGKVYNRAFNWAVCADDIANRFGTLRCTEDPQRRRDWARRQQELVDRHNRAYEQRAMDEENARARLSFMAAASTQLGRDITDAERRAWPNDFRRSAPARASMLRRFDVPVEEAKAYVRELLSRPAEIGLRDQAVTKAYAMVLNRQPTLGETANWSARLNTGKIGYVDIFTELAVGLKADPKQRAEVLDAAYLSALGRLPTTPEAAKEAPLGRTYASLVLDKRRLLYSAAGTDELVQTIYRVFAKRQLLPDAARAKAALQRCTVHQATFQEMAQPNSCFD